jgi:hypothetical protein
MSNCLYCKGNPKDYCKLENPKAPHLSCTRPRNHKGPHVACSTNEHMIETWGNTNGTTKVPPRRKCAWCKPGKKHLALKLLDEDGVESKISEKPGFPCHAYDDEHWLCDNSAEAIRVAYYTLYPRKSHD